MSALEAALGELEARLATITRLNGYATDLGLHVFPAGTWLSEEDVPCVAIYESRPDDSGVMLLGPASPDGCGVSADVEYLVQAFVQRCDAETPLKVAEAASADILKALFGGGARGAMTSADMHRFVQRGRGLTPRGGKAVPVLIHGRFTLKEGIYA